MPDRKHWTPCDFCGATPAVALHAVKDPPHPMMALAEDLEWAACTVCHAFLVRGDEPRHAMHCLRETAKRQNVEPRQVEHLVMPAHKLFWKIRTGEWKLLSSQPSSAV